MLTTYECPALNIPSVYSTSIQIRTPSKMPSIIVNEVEFKLNHLADLPLWETEKPYELNLTDLNSELPRTNCKYTQHNVHIRDVRGLRMQPSLETTGFQFVKHVSNNLPLFEDLSDETSNLAVVPYLQETINLVKQHLNAEKAFAIDWRVRSFLSQHLSNRMLITKLFSIGRIEGLPRITWQRTSIGMYLKSLFKPCIQVSTIQSLMIW